MEPGVPEEELAVGRQIHVLKVNANALLIKFLLYDVCNILSQLRLLVMLRASVVFGKFVA